ncbi:MAG: hypothetical protein ACJ74O_20800 [Frankiaceae bacterium]
MPVEVLHLGSIIADAGDAALLALLGLAIAALARAVASLASVRRAGRAVRGGHARLGRPRLPTAGDLHRALGWASSASPPVSWGSR